MNLLNHKKNTSHPPRSQPSTESDQHRRRNCLMCQQRFVSRHQGERICPACKTTDLWTSGASEYGLMPK